MNFEDITRPTKKHYTELCTMFNINPITGRSKKALKEKEQQLEDIRNQYDGEIKYNPKKKIYTLYPPMNKKQLEKHKKLQEARENNTLIVIQGNKEFIATDHNVSSNIKFKEFILYMASNFKGNKKSQFYILCFHAMALYNRVFNNYYKNSKLDGLEYLTQNYHPQVIKQGQELIFNKLRSYVNNALKQLEEKDGLIDIFDRYYTNEHNLLEAHDVYVNYSEPTFRKLHCANEHEALEKYGQMYLEARDELFQQCIREGKVPEIHPSKDYLKITERAFSFSMFPEDREKYKHMDRDRALGYLEDLSKVIQIRLREDIKKDNIKVTRKNKSDSSLDVGYSFEKTMVECFLPYLAIDRDAFIDPQVFQEQWMFDNYSVYMLKAVNNKGKVQKILNYRNKLLENGGKIEKREQ